MPGLPPTAFGSNVVVSIIRNVIPSQKSRVSGFVLIIASFVTVIQSPTPIPLVLYQSVRHIYPVNCYQLRYYCGELKPCFQRECRAVSDAIMMGEKSAPGLLA
jgi:hypothetical protein